MSAPAVRMPEEVRAELDQAFGSVPPRAPALEHGRSWDCLAGEGPAVCSHVRVTRCATDDGFTRVVCQCSHAWLEIES